MDDRTTRRTGPPIGVPRRGSCLFSVELNHETKANHYPTRIGGSTRVMAVKSNRIEDKEQGQASSTGGRPSSSKSLALKSVSPAPKLGSSSPSSLRKTRRTQQTSATSGQWNTTRNASLGLNQVGQDEPAFRKGLEHGPSSSSRLGLSEISNLTASEGLNSKFDYLQEVPTSSSSRSCFRSNSSVERGEPRVLSGSRLNRQGSWNVSDVLNVNSRLSDIVYDNEQQCAWTGIEDNGTMNLGLDPSVMSVAPTCMNDAASQSSIFGTGDHDTTSEDSFITVASITEDLYDMDVASRNDSVLHSSALVNQRAQEQGSLRRAMTGHGDSSPVSVDEVVSISRPSAYKRKTSTTRIASQGTSKSSSQDVFSVGSGSRERHAGRSTGGASTSRRNIGNFGCTSASDALSSNFSSSSDQDFEKTGNRRPDLVRRAIDGQDSARGRRLAKVSAASNSDGMVSQRNIRSGAGIAPHHQNSKTNLPLPRASRRTTRAMQPDTWCSQGLLAGDAAVESEIPSESSSSMRVAMLGNRPGGSSPPSIRGRSAAGTLQRRNNVPFGAACALGERVANRFVGSSSRGTSNSAGSGQLGLAGSAGRLNRSCADSDSVSYSLLSNDGIHNNMSITSAPAPSRPPPVSALSVSSQLHASSGAPVSLSFSGHVPPRAPSAALSSPISVSFASAADTSPSNLFDGSVFGRSISGGDSPSERPVPSHSEAVGRRAFRSLSIESDTPSRYAMEGLAEVLLALERIEQDEELTYEQVLMLEANLLFGGISMHDQHSDMRLDIDNMSYEELLALEERMGNVSTGLAEDAVSKCLTKCFYSSDAVTSSHSQESEVKCSVCQEEYEEKDELGRLSCDHSYHAACIRQWLLQKNQCPICKAPASI